MPRSLHRRARLLAAVACALLSAAGCRSVCCDTACEAESEAAREPLLQRRPLAGRLPAFQAKCADHFAEEPVVAPHPRFHPVPTRPVFAPVPPEELAMLLAPPTPSEEIKRSDVKPPRDEKPEREKPEHEKPGHASPPAVEPAPTVPAAPQERTARSDARARPISAPAPSPSELDAEPHDAPATSDAERESHTNSESELAVVHSIFAPTSPDDFHADVFAEFGSVADEPLLWRALPTPAGSLRAVPADEHVP